MARTLEDFVGTYTIRHGQGGPCVNGTPVIEDGFLLSIGTGLYGDPKPDGIRVGVAILNPDPAVRQRVIPQEGNPPAYAYLVEGTLNGSSYWFQGEELLELLTYQIALLTMTTPNGGLYKAPSIMITCGDPQNAGVWGADDDSGG